MSVTSLEVARRSPSVTPEERLTDESRPAFALRRIGGYNTHLTLGRGSMQAVGGWRQMGVRESALGRG